MGGLAAGILFFAAFYTIKNKENEVSTAVKKATLIAPIAIIIALICLFIDLKHKLYFWQLYTTFRIESPMSFGSWVLLFITPISMLWSFSYMRDLFPKIDWKYDLLYKIESWVRNLRKIIAWAMMFLAISLGIYTGILLSAFNARPLWNTAIFGPLFLLYGLLTASAVIMWMASSRYERNLFRKTSLVLIGIVLFLIIHLFMGYAAGPDVQVQSSHLFTKGEFALPFWSLVVGMGLILPGIIELFNKKTSKLPTLISAVLILTGGFLFRILIVKAGEMTRYLY